MNNSPKYVIITPVRNEAQFIGKTINSVISQTITPVEWLIVNDGSTDETGKIIDEFAGKYDFIISVHRKDRGYRKAGEGVVEAFNDGYRALKTDNWDFIIKLDGDLEFQKDYFERCFEYFNDDLKLGISGGGIYHILNDKMVLEEDPIFHVRGATKVYRRACWNDIGGLYAAPGWDTIDEVKAHMLGWKTKGFSELKVIHLRYTGAADGNWYNCVKGGLANYITGYHPIFMLLKCLKRIFQKPYGIMAIGLMYGFLGGYIKNIPQVADKELIRYVRREQVNRLLFKPSIWK